MSPLPAPTVNAITEYAQHASKNAYLGANWFEDLKATRALAADVINADASEIALIKNTSEGISLAAGGLTWKPGDVVVTTAVEYPTNLYPWMEMAHRHGIKIVRVPEIELPDGTVFSPDALFEDAALIHEVNGRQFHAADEAGEDVFEAMQRRHDLLVAAGVRALHNSPRRLRRDADSVLREVEEVYLRRAGRGMPPGVKILRTAPLA